MNVMEEYVGILNIQESKAQLDKPDLKKEDPKNLNINKDADIKNLQKTDVSSNIQNDFQLNSEKQLLKQLRKGRTEIESNKDELPAEKMALESIKQYIDNRLDALENLQNQLKRQFSNTHQNDGKKIQKLVKVYESMKPKEAAKIFNDLQIGVLVEMTLNMKESRLAAILSEMKPEKAKSSALLIRTL